MRAAVLLSLLLSILPAATGLATPRPASLVELINSYRSAAGACEDRPARAPGSLAPLLTPPALSRVQVGTGVFLEHALERIGYPVAQAEAIYITGPGEPRDVMDLLARRYCRSLLNPAFSAIGVSRSGDSWQIVLAQPAPPALATRLPALAQAGSDMLAAVNLARSSGRACGERTFAPAPPLRWNAALAEAALAHSGDMARQRYFSHQGKDGRVVAERAQEAGYRWRRIGENIAAGQETIDEVLAGWLTSPGHCANIMSAEFTEMGSAYAIHSVPGLTRAYWTQVFGTPR